ncbi:hypothetical protein [Photobacterium aquimaris]|uniref:DUF4136 domain-containing protein n=1 Tax=Photobacterium aquimaris TaxID=512643 RepID=A0A2T3HWC1_9GAMM|nr:hypothetical protein [Photobacterium aquimaris]OBU22240.1 hypothetical protein AYY21_03175 [Photobacterium aquimaris]PQJ38288.1 hypothetical protein BTN98_12640 [Photobacterium aquimaris]PSU03216.1 hypothetical protein C0W81_12450 [Photobacterium aquimaris]
MNIKIISIALVAAFSLAGCKSTSLAKTKETKRSYAVYDLKVSKGVSSSDMSKAIKTALQANTSSVRITEDLPPYPIPKESPRFQLVNPFGNNSALAALAGGAAKRPTCDGALIYAQATDSSMSSQGENTQFYTCLWQYDGGYHIDIYTQFDIVSGGLENLGKDLIRGMMGDSSQFIPRTIASLRDNLEALNVDSKLVTAYPSDFEVLLKERQIQQ